MLFAALSAGNFFGCLATDQNPNLPLQDCESIDVLAAQACNLRDMDLVEGCEPNADPDDCIHITYQPNSSCADRTATATCRPRDIACAIPPVSPQEACLNEGFQWTQECADTNRDIARLDDGCVEIAYQAGGDCGEVIERTFCSAAPIACAIPPVSPQQACERLGLTLVEGCVDDGSQTDCQSVSYQVGGDCGEETDTVTCANIDHCLEPTIALPPPCEEMGLETIFDDSECAVIIHLTEDGEIEEIILDGEQEEESEQESETGCVEVHTEDGESMEVGCSEDERTSEPQPGRMCFAIATAGFCGQIGETLCAEPTPQPYDACDEIDCPAGTHCEIEEIYQDCGPDCHSSVPVERAMCVSEVCSFIYAPVCGVDGVTYANDCQAGPIDIAHDGECEPAPPSGSCEALGLLSPESELDVRVLLARDAATGEAVTTVHVAFSVFGPYGAVCEGGYNCEPVADHIIAEALTVTIDGREDDVRRVLSSNWDAPLESEALEESTFFQLDGHILGFYEAELDLVINGQPCVITNQLNLIEGEQEG